MLKKIKRFKFGNPYDTEATIKEIQPSEISQLKYLDILNSDGSINLIYNLHPTDIVLGLGQSLGGINKRGREYIMFSSDDPSHTESKKSLYGVHPFFIVDGKSKFGVFIDYPSKMTIDIGFENPNKISIKIPSKDFNIYIFEDKTSLNITHLFHSLVGRSFLPPKWAFGYQQSRWSYENSEKIDSLIENFRKNSIPCDAIYLDIDYMKDFMDFTVEDKQFPNFKKWIGDKKSQGIKIVPIIDAGVKIKDSYFIYEEAKLNNYFCKTKDNKDFIAAVWPGLCSFPDFLNPEVRKWWGKNYKILTDCGIEGFWNDMNEPAIFYSPERLDSAISFAEELKGKNLGVYEFFNLKDRFASLSNNEEDYKLFYHRDKDGNIVNHYDVHNLYGTNMTRAASEGLKDLNTSRYLLFSRASYIGAHRYGGVWTGDNHSWWSHLLLNIQMLTSLNICGFIYSGADTGGFGGSASSELITRWNQFSVFTPLFRNHSAMGTRNQEPFAYDTVTLNNNRNIINIRYSLLPYIYSEFLKARDNSFPYMMPLSFVYKNNFSRLIEDQVLVGDSLMVAPIYTGNARGRGVYLPEDMLLISMIDLKDYRCKLYKSGYHYIDYFLDNVSFFLRKNKIIPLTEPMNYVGERTVESLQVIAFVVDRAVYTLLDDDGISKNSEKISIQMEIEFIQGVPNIDITKSGKTSISKINFIIFDQFGSKFFQTKEI